jgi:mannose-6-phosphate isomerase-like protein (cupin superfamily)
MAVLPVSEIFLHPEGRARLATHGWQTDETRRYFLSIDRRLAGGTGRSGAHVHLDCDTSFQLRSGRALYEVDGEQRALEVGERVVVPAGTPHVDPYTEPGQEAELYLTMEPGREFAYRFARTFGRALAAGEVNEQHELRWLHLMVVLRATRAETYAVGPPRLIQKHIAIPLAAWIGRRVFGYQVAWQ